MHTRRLQPLLALAAAAVVTAGLPAAAETPAAYERPGDTIRVSSAPDGGPGDDRSGTAGGTALSADGRVAAFHSEAGNLVPDDTNGWFDVFVWEEGAEALERVSVAGDGAQGNRSSFRPSLSADGRYVAFDSRATNFDPRMPAAPDDFAIFRHDRVTGETELVSVARDGGAINGRAQNPSISADGRHVAFQSRATNVVAAPVSGTVSQVYVRDIAAGTTEIVSVTGSGAPGNGTSFDARISGDGRHVTFHTLASNFAPGTGGSRYEAVVHDREAGVTSLVSADDEGVARGGEVPSISHDGRYIAFYTQYRWYTPGSGVAGSYVIVRDMHSGRLEQVTVHSDGRQGTGWAPALDISPDGRYVAFQYHGSDILPGPAPGNPNLANVLLHDRLAGSTERITWGLDGGSNGTSSLPRVSADGRRVLFTSVASNLVPGPQNAHPDVYVRDRGPEVGVVGPVDARRDADAVEVSGAAAFSGTVVAEAARDADDLAVAARTASLELVGAQLVYRPEPADLLVRLRVSQMRTWVLGRAGLHGVVYGLAFDADGDRYEVRISQRRIPPVLDDPGGPYDPPTIGLFRCAVACELVAPLSGEVGVTGAAVTVALPLAALGVGEGTAVTDVEAFIRPGIVELGGPGAADRLTLPDGAIPDRRVTVGLGEPDKEVELAAGRFSTILPDVGDAAPPVRVRVCLGERCATAETAVR